MTKITVKPNQTLTDIAVQYLGDQSGVMQIARLNNLNVTDALVAGQVLALPDIINKRIEKVVRDNNYQPAAGAEQSDEGIGYWAIEVDFEVQ